MRLTAEDIKTFVQKHGYIDGSTVSLPLTYLFRRLGRLDVAGPRILAALEEGQKLRLLNVTEHVVECARV